MPRPKNKTAIKAAVREVIDACPMGSVMTPEQTEWMCRNLEVEYRYFRHVPNPTFPSDIRYLETSQNGVAWTSFSWNKAIDRPDPKQRILTAMRKAVWNGKRMDYWVNNEKVCAVCSSTENPCVDHNKTPFIEIANLYIATFGVAEPIDGLPGEGPVMQDLDRLQWVEFHDLMADFQMLCRSCNSSKGAR